LINTKDIFIGLFYFSIEKGDGAVLITRQGAMISYRYRNKIEHDKKHHFSSENDLQLSVYTFYF